MSKYRKFNYEPDLLFQHESYEVHRAPKYMCGRILLVLGGTEVAFRFETDKPTNYMKWIHAWEKNAFKQLKSLDRRISNLNKEKNEIEMRLLLAITKECER